MQIKRIERAQRPGSSRSADARDRNTARTEPEDALVVLSRQAFDRLVALARRVRPEVEVEAMPLDIAPDDLPGNPVATDSAGSATALARKLLHLRRRRTAFFDGDLFSDPAWDMLLSLYLAECEGRLIGVSGACAAAKVPQTTGLRWLGRLESQGLVLREADRHDARRSNVRLSPRAFQRVHDLLAETAG